MRLKLAVMGAIAATTLAIGSPTLAGTTHHSQRHHIITTTHKLWTDVPWCKPTLAKVDRRYDLVHGWGGVTCSVDFTAVWFWVDIRMWVHQDKELVTQASSGVKYSEHPNTFHATSAYAHCRWWGGPGSKNERNWMDYIGISGLWAGEKVNGHDAIQDTVRCVGRKTSN